MVFGNFKKTAVLSAVAALFGVTDAEADGGNMALDVKASTLGVGLELTVSVIDKVNLRFGGNYFNLSKSLEEGGNDYDFDLKMQNYTILADWHPLGDGFRVSGGVVVDKNELDGLARESNTYNIGGFNFTRAAVGELRGVIKFRTLSPYLGLGWGNAFDGDNKFHITFDVGVVFTGTPLVTLTSTGGLLSENEILLEAMEEERKIVADDIDFFKYYPVISIGAIYRF